MSKRIVLLSFFYWSFVLPIFAQQKIMVNVTKEENIEEVAKERAMRITNLLNTKVKWDGVHQTMFLNRYIDVERRYFRAYRNSNPKDTSVLLRNQGLMRFQRNEILRNLLEPAEFSKFLVLESEIQKKDILRQKLDIHKTTPLLKGQIEALGWDLLLDTLSIQRK